MDLFSHNDLNGISKLCSSYLLNHAIWSGLDALLDLDGYIVARGLGCWVKVDTWWIEVTLKIPHGIRYSLTLHEPYGKRLIWPHAS
ncbi:MAG: hypothetical protein ABI167_05040 [Nitrosospira sp.]